MSTLTVEKEMLYCPKCQRKYEDGTQRFCNSDGGRLLPSTNSAKSRPSGGRGVFTSLLGRIPSSVERDEKIVSKPRIVNSRRARTEGFQPGPKSSMFKSDAFLAPTGEQPVTKPMPANATPKAKLDKSHPGDNQQSAPSTRRSHPDPINRAGNKLEPSTTLEHAKKDEADSGIEAPKPISRLIDPKDISSGSAPLGDRAMNPQGRTALSWKDPGKMLGQVVKGRYRIIKSLGQDSSSMVFVAEDKILKSKNVVVRILNHNGGGNSFEDKIFLEERISLSHVNHPNVAKVVDSGELPEGNHFIVTSELRTNSVESLLGKTQPLNPMRIARIVRQASYALSEVHQNGILHRNVKPEHILLTVSEAGIEQVKVTDFCVSDGRVDGSNFRFKAPEQIGGQLPTFSSDSYALAVIAYRLLTKRFPFEGESEREIMRAQKQGLVVKPSELNSQLSESVDAVFVRALDFEAAKRYPKARDFGEFLFNAINEGIQEDLSEEVTVPGAGAAVTVEDPRPLETFENTAADDTISLRSDSDRLKSDIHIDSSEGAGAETVEEILDTASGETVEKVGTNETLWQNRSPEPVSERGLLWTILPALGILLLFLATVGIWWLFYSQESSRPIAPSAATSNNPADKSAGVDQPANLAKVFSEYDDAPPVAREITPPEGGVFFENSRLNLSEQLVQKYQGFSLYYPETWKIQKFDNKNDRVDDKFVDLALNNSSGMLLEHLTIEPYTSAGTFTADTELFPKLVEKSNKDIADAMPGGSFRVVEQGVNSIQNGRWKTYEVSFEVKGKVDGDGKPLTLWGRRLWIPVQNKNARTGFIITMLATSLSKDVTKAEEVGRKGDLKDIIQTFEPKP